MGSELRQGSLEERDVPQTCTRQNGEAEREHLAGIPVGFLTAQNTPIRAKQDNLLNCKTTEGRKREFLAWCVH